MKKEPPVGRLFFVRFPDYIDQYDDLIDVIRRKDGSVRLMPGKKINGHSVMIEAASAGRQALHPVTAYQIDSERYEKEYKPKAVGRSATSCRTESDYVDISRPATASNSSIPQADAKSQGDTVDGLLTGTAAEDLQRMAQNLFFQTHAG